MTSDASTLPCKRGSSRNATIRLSRWWCSIKAAPQAAESPSAARCKRSAPTSFPDMWHPSLYCARSQRRDNLRVTVESPTLSQREIAPRKDTKSLLSSMATVRLRHTQVVSFEQIGSAKSRRRHRLCQHAGISVSKWECCEHDDHNSWSRRALGFKEFYDQFTSRAGIYQSSSVRRRFSPSFIHADLERREFPSHTKAPRNPCELLSS